MVYPYHIFISYSTQNRQLVDHLSLILKEGCPGANVFDAEYSVEFGDDIALAVYSELIPRTDTVILLWTPEAAGSNWVHTEAAYSYLFGKHVVQIKTAPQVPVASVLRHLKYVSTYRFNSMTDCFKSVAQHVAKRARRHNLCRRLLLAALKTRYAFSLDDDTFYNFAVSHLRSAASDTALFVTGSPVLVLPQEADTDARRLYLDLLIHRYSRRGCTGTGKYVFNQNATYGRLMENIPEAEQIEGHLGKVAPLLSSNAFDLFASRNIDFLPSGLITTDSAALVLKDPSIPSRTVGVYFIKGKEAQDVRRRLLLLLRDNLLIPQRIWVPELIELVRDRLAMRSQDKPADL
jgi:hypothetical protein